ncbi:Meckel syndrome type 1 protein homolog [Leptopilina heterotoma]|uniref:Meckel syndrome type 1 protein homolog n=1 Tax=Leptopilina heterotoma TaxID=63436 RepID=UPI001CA9F929|nr:Meckel syndrome type 1 protein homolog [Leptopilina heterotoma]
MLPNFDDEDDPGEPKIAGTYRVEQPINNFKLRIKISQQKSPIYDLFDDPRETLDANFLEEEEYTFSWQEKVFSPFEVKYFSEEKNCITDIQKDYHKKIADDDIEGSRLYTKINEDSFYPDNSLFTRPFTSPLALKNERAMPCLRNRKPFSQRYNKKVIDEKPDDDRLCANHYFYEEREVMYILADVSPKNEEPSNSKDSENLLCTVTYDKAHKLLTVDPDFSNEGYYRIFGTGMGYDYWISHESCTPTEDDEENIIKTLKQEFQKVQNFKEFKISPKLELVPLYTFRIILNLEILSAHDFSYDSLFITYFLHLPKNWSTPRQESLAGRTQRCRMKKKTANFSYIIENCLDLDLKSLKKKNGALSWPYLLFTVASLDNWERWRIEGYGSSSLPLTSGCHNLKIHTWRQSGGFIDSLRWFFTGGINESENNFNIPDINEERKINRREEKIIPSGYIKIRANIVHQSQIFTKEGNLGKNVFDKLNSNNLMINVEDVLVQFQIARERMIRAKNFS